MNRNVKIAKELVRLAKSLVAGDESKFKREVEKELDKVQEEDIKQEIETVITGSIKVAFDWKEQLKKIGKWIGEHKIATSLAVSLVCFILHKWGWNAYNNGGLTTTEAMITALADMLGVSSGCVLIAEIADKMGWA